MSPFFKTTAALLIFFTAQANLAQTEATPDVDQEAAQIEEIKTKDEVWNQQLKEKYALTDEQIKTLHASGLSYPHLAMVAQLSKSSEKPLEDVLKMRTEQKMGWGKIAKELGVHPREIGQSVRDLKHAIRDQRKEERKIARAEKKEKTEEKRAQREEKREKQHQKK